MFKDNEAAVEKNPFLQKSQDDLVVMSLSEMKHKSSQAKTGDEKTPA